VTDDLIDMVSKTDLQYVARCDHSAISVRLNLDQTQTGPGLWRCSPSLTEDLRLYKELTVFCANTEYYIPNLDALLQWDFLTCRLKSFIQAYSNEAAAKRCHHYTYLQHTRIRLLRQPTDAASTTHFALVES
jgi:RNAse (barnase) inhibitor barstar